MNKFETLVYRRFDGFTEHIASVQNMAENLAQAAHAHVDHLAKRIDKQTKDMDAINDNVQKVHRNLKAFMQDNSAMRQELATTRAHGHCQASR
jgi:septal ring factor EnvC (AmiA/AmiB activator)